jgi:deazaflavin-dependent oxidoreductase (nitroreductase family)
MDEPARVEAPATSASRTVTLIRRVVRPIWLLAGVAGVLEVADRRSGVARQVTLAPIRVDRSCYLVSMYGVTGWVRDLRAAGRADLRRKGRTETFTAVEVDDDERVRVIAAYHARSRGPLNEDFDQLPRAADHPVFRVDPVI